MYEERKDGISLRGIIIQILLVVLVVFLLLWLFPTKSYVKDYADNAFTSKLQPLYSQIFSQNITTMKESAIAYFTTDRLPSKVGDNVTMTLKEMQDKKLVLDLIDSNNNKCDIDKSYVKIVKEKNEYLMTVSLNCSDKEDYIEVHLGCYDYCEASGVCEKKEEVTTPTTPIKPVVTKKYQYEYEKVTDGKWGPWGNWSSWTTTEATKTDYRNVESKTEKVEAGTKEVLTGYKTEVETLTAKSEIAGYKCPDGYSATGTITANTTCKKTTKTTSTAKAIASSSYYTDWVYQGKYTYNSIQYSSDTRKVVRVSSSINTDCTTNCTTNTYTYLVYTRNLVTTYKCPTGYSATGTITASTTCKKTTTSSSTAKAVVNTYKCPTGYSATGTIGSNTTCEKSNIIKTPIYEKITLYQDVTYYRTQTREFISGTRDIKWSTSKNDTTLINQGYVLTGNKKEIK